jgi:ParB family chromosome partitioning protein
VANDAELAALKASIAARGQQAPIEVEDLGNGRYGLISGWRRLEALRALQAEADEGEFGQIRAFIRTLETVSDAYIAMVEENEIRANLSFYERARISDQAAEKGVFPTAEIAVKELFRHASRAKRSKILSFLRLYRALDGLLRFPTALSERQGLAVVKALDAEPAIESRIHAELRALEPETPEDEANALTDVIYSGPFYTPSKPRAAKASSVPKALPGGVRMNTGSGRVELIGTGVDAAFIADLKAWLADRESD